MFLRFEKWFLAKMQCFSRKGAELLSSVEERDKGFHPNKQWFNEEKIP